MAQEVDYNKLIAELVTQSSVMALGKISEISGKISRGAINIFSNTFKSYLMRMYEKNSKIKTILHRDRPVPLRDFYVETAAALEDDVIDAKSLDDLFGLSNFLVFSGTAGCGKSTFMKHLFLRFIEEQSHGIPLYIELRFFNRLDGSGILQHLFTSVQVHNSKFEYDYLLRCLRRGTITCIFDGLDEVDRDLRQQVDEEIVALAETYPKSRIVVSSRPDETLTGWQEFVRLSILPLDRDMAIALVSRLQYDQTVKERFIDELKRDLFDQHSDFLSNPLLLTIMLLTYEQIAEIPSKMHIFYEQAFETLFNKHDATKELYKRKTYTGLPIDEFRRALAAFSFATYIAEKKALLSSEALEYLGRASQLTHLGFGKHEMLGDLTNSVCVLVRDGMYYTYAHRSFQEYFAAVFVASVASEKRGDLIARLAKVNPYDNALALLAEMNRDLVERDYVVPQLKKLLDDLESLRGGVYRYVRVNALFVEGLALETIGSFCFMFAYGSSGEEDGLPRYHRLLQELQTLFPDHFEWQRQWVDKYMKSNRSAEVIKKWQSETESRRDVHWFSSVDRKKHELFAALGLKERAQMLESTLVEILAYLEEKFDRSERDIISLLDL